MREHALLRTSLLLAWLAAPSLGSAQGSGPSQPPAGLGQLGQDAAAEPRLSEPEPPAADSSAPQVARAVFSRAISGREPDQQISELDMQADRVFFFTELVGLEGHTVKHVWSQNGVVMAEVPFTVGASRWRAYSSKKLFPGAPQGTWTVTVVDESGRELHRATLGYAYAGGQGPAQPSPAAPADRD